MFFDLLASKLTTYFWGEFTPFRITSERLSTASPGEPSLIFVAYTRDIL